MELTNITDTDPGSTVAKYPCFRSCRNMGFQMTFSNGWMISVQFGAFNYCSNRDLNADSTMFLDGPKGTLECANAEVAVFNPDGDFVRPDGFDFGEDVKGFVSPDEVSLLVRWVSSR